MQLFKRFTIGLLALSLAVFSFAGIAFATMLGGGALVSVDENEVYEGDLFVSGEEVFVHGRVQGDLFVAGGRVLIDGTVDGDIYAVGGEILIAGTVGQDVIAFGGEIDFDSATVGDGVIAAGGRVGLDEATSVGGGFVGGGGAVVVRGAVQRGMIAAGALVEFSGSALHDVFFAGEDIRLLSSAEVGEDFTYFSREEARIYESTVIGGETKHLLPPEISSPFAGKTFKGLFLLWSYLATLLVGCIVLYLFPKQCADLSVKLHKHPWRSLFYGVAALIIVPILMMIFALSVIGLPLTVISGLLYVLALLLTRPFIGIFYGNALAKLLRLKKWSPYTLYVFGLAAFMALTHIPYLGFFIGLTSFVFVFGAMTMVAMGVTDKFKKGKV